MEKHISKFLDNEPYSLLLPRSHQIIPSIVIENTDRLLLKYATGSGKTLIGILLATKYRDTKTIFVTFMAQ